MAATKARGEPDGDDSTRTGGRKGGSLSASSAAEHAVAQVGELIAGRAVAVTSVEPAEDAWQVEVEVLEEQRIPSSADRLALYQVDLDAQGELLAYRRTKQYARGKSGGPNGGAPT